MMIKQKQTYLALEVLYYKHQQCFCSLLTFILLRTIESKNIAFGMFLNYIKYS